MDSILRELVHKIIHEQEVVIGELAWEQAEKVVGLRIDIQNHEVDIEGDVRDVLERLVAQYEKIFGITSREVCREAIRPLLSRISQDDIPAVLR